MPMIRKKNSHLLKIIIKPSSPFVEKMLMITSCNVVFTFLFLNTIVQMEFNKLILIA